MNDKYNELRELAKKYNLKGQHFHQDSRGFIIITRSGVEQIQAHMNITVVFHPVYEWSNPLENRYVIKAIATMPTEAGTAQVVTFGEVTSKNNRNAYPIAMAEKRALSRAVLKLAGMYKHNVYGEDEVEAKTEKQ